MRRKSIVSVIFGKEKRVRLHAGDTTSDAYSVKLIEMSWNNELFFIVKKINCPHK